MQWSWCSSPQYAKSSIRMQTQYLGSSNEQPYRSN